MDHLGLSSVNNENVLSPDGRGIFLSADDGHVYRASLDGGEVRRLPPPADGSWHFLHGVSSDGGRLGHVPISTFEQPGRLAVLDLVTATSTARSGHRTACGATATTSRSQPSPVTPRRRASKTGVARRNA